MLSLTPHLRFSVQGPNIFEGPLPTPSQLLAEMDKHVIGQAHAKKVLSVGVYNHFKRLRIENDRKNRMQQLLNRFHLSFDAATTFAGLLIPTVLLRYRHQDPTMDSRWPARKGAPIQLAAMVRTGTPYYHRWMNSSTKYGRHSLSGLSMGPNLMSVCFPGLVDPTHRDETMHEKHLQRLMFYARIHRVFVT